MFETVRCLSGVCQVYCCFKLACDVTDFEAYFWQFYRFRLFGQIGQKVCKSQVYNFCSMGRWYLSFNLIHNFQHIYSSRPCIIWQKIWQFFVKILTVFCQNSDSFLLNIWGFLSKFLLFFVEILRVFLTKFWQKNLANNL
jgi:hypothetical protein